ncbi:hypothetical protein HUA78_12795 [Myxococcus sp. CA033]|nr:hypothetical protein [Myxococcus sp. CA033]NTX35326.1 hypothetical protein [Myxococcus sp. CA033]
MLSLQPGSLPTRSTVVAMGPTDRLYLAWTELPESLPLVRPVQVYISNE